MATAWCKRSSPCVQHLSAAHHRGHGVMLEGCLLEAGQHMGRLQATPAYLGLACWRCRAGISPRASAVWSAKSSARELMKSRVTSVCGLPLFAEENNSELKYLLVTHSSACLHHAFREQMQFSRPWDFLKEPFKCALVKNQRLSTGDVMQFGSSRQLKSQWPKPFLKCLQAAGIYPGGVQSPAEYKLQETDAKCCV